MQNGNESLDIYRHSGDFPDNHHTKRHNPVGTTCVIALNEQIQYFELKGNYPLNQYEQVPKFNFGLEILV